MPDVFQEEEFRYSGGRYKDQLFRYRLYRPPTQIDGEKLPLILWLHGTSDKGDDNIGQLKWLDLIIEDPECPQAYPFYVLALQCPTENPSWFRGDSSTLPEDDMLSVAVAALDKVIATYPVDPDRVSVAGLSAGGTASWAIASRYPDRFAAVVPLSGSATGVSNLEAVVDIPVWVFHSQNDQIIPLKRSIDAIESLKQRGGNIHVTVFDRGGHNSWTRAIRDYAIIDWMIAQRRNEHGLLTRPGFVPWRVHKAAIAAAMVKPIYVIPTGLACLAVWTAWRLRRFRRGNFA